MGNAVVHWELMSKEPGKVADFYAKIFGWKVHHHPGINYRVVETGAPKEMPGINGGIVKPDREGPWPGNMLFYILVDDLTAYRREIVAAAAKSTSRCRRCPGWASSPSSPIRKAA
jgi:predicted enzyme related to lactoylglutathione lyase